MSGVEEQAKELGVDAAGGAKDGGQKRDTMFVSVGMLGAYLRERERERRLLLSWDRELGELGEGRKMFFFY